MKKLIAKTGLLAGLMAGAMFFGGGAQAAEGAAWTYSGENGPEKWGTLAPDNIACSMGKNQSPVDLKNLIQANLKPIKFDYKPGGYKIVNNGHTIQVEFNAGSTITVDNTEFALKQFHFHSPSENLINGKQFPLEVHLVHADKDGNLAVVGVMFDEGKPNKALAKIWPLMPKEAGGSAEISPEFLASTLLPASRSYYRFNGSLTTPPCSEGVRWLVMKKPVTVSKEQVEEFMHIIHHPNARPVQPVNARPLLK